MWAQHLWLRIKLHFGMKAAMKSIANELDDRFLDELEDGSELVGDEEE